MINALPDNVIIFPIARALNISLFKDIKNLSLTNKSDKYKVITYTKIGRSYLQRKSRLNLAN